jgi:hypothetical protein
MTPCKRLFLCGLGALLLSGCWNGRVLYSFEEPFWTVMGGARARLPLVKTALVKGYLPRIDVAPAATDPRERLAAGLSQRRYSLAVVGPLLSFESDAYAGRFPGTRFVLIDVHVQGRSLPPNAVALSFDRTGAFREAGAAVAAALQAEFAASTRADGSGAAAASSTPPARVGTLLSASSDISAEEEKAFLAGAGDGLRKGTPIERILPSPADKAAVISAVAQMRSQGVEVFLIGLGILNPAALEALRGAGGSAVLADWSMAGGFDGQVLLSIENDVAAGVALAIDALGSDMQAVSGPVRIVAGKARHPALPAGSGQADGIHPAEKGKKI